MGGKKKPDRSCELIKETAKAECGKDGVCKELGNICDCSTGDKEIDDTCSEDKESECSNAACTGCSIV